MNNNKTETEANGNRDQSRSLDSLVRELNKMGRDSARWVDTEMIHREADALLCEALRLTGGEKVAKAFERARKRVGFWYS